MQFPLCIVVEAELHVVAQVVEAKFVVGAVGDVRRVGLFAANGPQVERAVVFDQVGRVKEEAGLVNDRGHRQPQGVVDWSHPLHVTPGEVVVHRDQVRATAEQRVQIERQGRNQGLAFASLHLGNLPLVEHGAAEELAVEVTHAGGPA